MTDMEEGVNRLKQIQKQYSDDLEFMHVQIDKILVEFVPTEIRETYLQIKKEVGGFWYG